MAYIEFINLTICKRKKWGTCTSIRQTVMLGLVESRRDQGRVNVPYFFR